MARILHTVGAHPTEKGVDIQDCLTKFDPDRIKKRRCFSLSDIESDDSWEAAGPDDATNTRTLYHEHNFEEDVRARRYSFPLSPTRLTNLPNTLVFERECDAIKNAGQDFLIDNVYTDTKPVLDPFAKRKVKTVSRRT